MNPAPILAALALIAVPSTALAQLVPVVSNVQAGQRDGTKYVDITYDVAYGGGPVTVWIDVSNDGGRSYIVPAKTFQGHIGQGVSPGTGRLIAWDAAADFDGMLTEQMRVRVTARAGTVPVPPPHMVFIPGGHFYMGEWTDGSSASARRVYISPMFMDRYEVWGSFYTEVREWAMANGYGNSMESTNASAGNHPVQNLNWYSMVKWCNARSEREGLTPVYYTDSTHTTVYRDNVDRNLANSQVKWDANGYRLPTEAEWEKAARGGSSGKEYLWGDTLDGTMANYSGATHPWSDFLVRTTPVGYYNGEQAGGGNDMANGYGLYDMAGNVSERVWDRFSNTPTGDTNPRGTDGGAGSFRVLRNGGWSGLAADLRSAKRAELWVYNSGPSIGFRCVRGL